MKVNRLWAIDRQWNGLFRPFCLIDIAGFFFFLSNDVQADEGRRWQWGTNGSHGDGWRRLRSFS
ncbi:hypothetical protein GBL_3485 [Geobacillus kaustophilus GBlys]|uniref:Uncharacterized protein n=1 Tax=Geobacillus kaustophilus GBlys TaxID=1337888 RepID=U2YDS2_GEOKU|nr:hypothetical protein GBL_3485 [Geobacillus kaustophilus GBlys]